MRWLTILVAVLLVAGCADSGDDTAQSTTTDAAPDSRGHVPPRAYQELMARLPPFDEPASREVTAYREAVLGGFLERCASSTGGARKGVFVAANRKVLDSASPVAGATLVGEYSVEQRDGNGCPDGTGPPTYFTTYRTYRLPAGTRPLWFSPTTSASWPGGWSLAEQPANDASRRVRRT